MREMQREEKGGAFQEKEHSEKNPMFIFWIPFKSFKN